jgi:hypothetical protein
MAERVRQRLSGQLTSAIFYEVAVSEWRSVCINQAAIGERCASIVCQTDHAIRSKWQARDGLFRQPLKHLAGRLLLAVLLALICGLAYARTLAPGVTWANGGADSGDLLAAAATGGIPHPTGYPTYLLLAALFLQLPLGDPARQVTLLSSVSALLAVLLIYRVVLDILNEPTWRAAAAAGVAALSLGISPLFWSQAVIAEVHSLNALFVALLLLAIVRAARAPQAAWGWPDRLYAYLAGLALGNHVTIGLLVLLWLLAIAGVRGQGSGVREDITPQSQMFVRAEINASTNICRFTCLVSRVSCLLSRLVWLCAGLLVYLALPLRAVSGAPVSWGGAGDWAGFWWLVSGRAYASLVWALPAEMFEQRLLAWAGLLGQQFGWFGTSLGLFGLLYGVGRRSLKMLTLVALAGYSLFAIGYDTGDSYVYLLPAYVIFAIWIGLGSAALIALIERRSAVLAPLGASLPALLLLWALPGTLHKVDASQDQRAIVYAQRVLAQAPTGALIVTSADRDTFPLWYYHYGRGQRPDLAIVAGALLEFRWYREQLRAVYPDLNIPQQQEQGWAGALVVANQRPWCRTGDVGPELVCARLEQRTENRVPSGRTKGPELSAGNR